MNYRRWYHALAHVALGVSSTFAFAQGEHKVSASRIEVGSWVFQAAYQPNAAGTATTIVNIFAFAKPGTAIDENLVAVWYQKQLDGTWNSKSWVTTDQAAVVKSLKQDLNIQDSEDDKWATTGVATSASPPPSEGYAGGLLIEDPLAAFVHDSPDPESIVAVLANAGYKAAVVPTDDESKCSPDAQLSGMANELASMISTGDETVLTLASGVGTCEAFAGLYPKAPGWGTPNIVKPAKPATAPAWTPAPIVPTAPAWTPNTWSVWKCTSTPIGVGTSTECICRRSRRWGAWETNPDCSIWPGNQPCIRWREVIERNYCTDIGTPAPCPAAGPPTGTSCNSLY